MHYSPRQLQNRVLNEVQDDVRHKCTTEELASLDAKLSSYCLNDEHRLASGQRVIGVGSECYLSLLPVVRAT